MRENRKLLMEIGGEGGSLMLYCDQGSASPKYWAVIDESYDLAEEDGGNISIHREADTKDNWRDALNSWPWSKLYPVFVDATIQVEVLKAVIEEAGNPSLDRWAEICCEQAKVEIPSKFTFARRVLLMVEELHRMGYQLLRIIPGLSPSGTYWLCTIAPAPYTSSHHGAMLHDDEDSLLSDQLIARYSTADEDKYFGWTDAAALTLIELAHRFLDEFPSLAKAGKGSDWAYAGWYQEVIRLSASANLPIAYRVDKDEPECPAMLFDLDKDGFIPTEGERPDIWIPMPPLSVEFV